MPHQTPLQRRAVDAILGKMEFYLDARFQAVKRINPKVEAIWDDLAWQQLEKLRISLTNRKAYGPERYHVAELMLSDDERKIRELYGRKSQNSLMGEIYEERESGAARTTGQMEIHDMRTLCAAIDPSLESIVALMQTYTWWDLEDAADLARFDKKVGLVNALEDHGLTDEMAQYYRDNMGLERKPTKDEAIQHELRMLSRTINSFRTRREEEREFHVIIARKKQSNEDTDRLIDALAQQIALDKSLREGNPLTDEVRQQIAKAMHEEPDNIDADKVIRFLDQMIANNKRRLRNSLIGSGSGEPYNLKRYQLEELEKRFQEIAGDREYDSEQPPAPSSSSSSSSSSGS